MQRCQLVFESELGVSQRGAIAVGRRAGGRRSGPGMFLGDGGVCPWWNSTRMPQFYLFLLKTAAPGSAAQEDQSTPGQPHPSIAGSAELT